MPRKPSALPFSLGDRVSVRIEVPRGSRIKRNARAEVEFVSPLPSPFNYGAIESDLLAADGEGHDALFLGPKRRLGARVSGHILAAVDFLDRGRQDTKWIVGDRLSSSDRARIERFFRRYARIKRLLRATNQTRYRGWLL